MPAASLWMSLFVTQKAERRTLREQVCAAIRLALHGGHLKRDERLPSSRQLAQDLGVSRVTVEGAYGQLEAEGYLRRQVGGGTFVAFASVRHAAPLARSIGAPAKLSGRGSAIVAGGGCRDTRVPQAFSGASPDLSAFPLETWHKLGNRLSRRGGRDLLGFGDPQGFAPLREAVAHYLNQSRGVHCSAGQILILTSSQQALTLIATLLLDDGDAAWVEDPCYEGARTAFASAGAKLVPVPVDADGMDVGAAPAGAEPRLIYLTPSHQYPTGASLSLARRMALLDLARERDAWIVEDDYDSEFHYDGRPLPSLQGLDRDARVLYVGTFSKVLFPALRLAYLVLPPSLIEAFTVARTVQDGHTTQWTQAVTAAFIEEGHFAAHLRQMRQLYRSRRDLLREELEKRTRGWLDILPTAGGLKMAVHLPAGKEDRYTRRAAQLGVATPGLSRLYLGPARDGWLLGFSALDNAAIRHGALQLARIPEVKGR
ncbi:MAG TPA: PLP-dependent aminotransferase family protein [Burkholderiaceae bacterium]